MKKFTQEQIETLRNEYNKIEAMPLEYASRFCETVAKGSDETILQLSDAGIKFVSRIAKNEAFRRGLVA